MTTPPRTPELAAELRALMSRPATVETQTARLAQWDAAITDALELAYAYRAAGAQTWAPIDDVVAGTERPQVRRAREWAEVAGAHELDQQRQQDAARLGVDLDSDQLAYPAALREVGDDPRARAALETAMADLPGRRPVEAMRSEQTALDRIRAVPERVQAADFQLDHAQADVKNQQPVSAGERLAAVRALLADGDRLLQEAASAAHQPADSPQVSDPLRFPPTAVRSDRQSVGPVTVDGTAMSPVSG